MKKLLLAAVIAVAAGCSADLAEEQNGSFTQRQDKALSDPMHYTPPTNYGVSEDKGLKHDLHDVMDP